VPLHKYFTRRLAKTKFGQKSLTEPDELSIFKEKPDTRVYVGLILIVMSFLIGLPSLALLGYLSVKLSKPMTIAIGGPVVILLGYVMFGLGVYLTGKNYAAKMLKWATKRFLEKYA
jgi:hypothetical protein